jgi:hypothetical protein
MFLENVPDAGLGQNIRDPRMRFEDLWSTAPKETYTDSLGQLITSDSLHQTVVTRQAVGPAERAASIRSVARVRQPAAVWTSTPRQGHSIHSGVPKSVDLQGVWTDLAAIAGGKRRGFRASRTRPKLFEVCRPLQFRPNLFQLDCDGRLWLAVSAKSARPNATEARRNR